MMKRATHDPAHFNLAGEYNKARNEGGKSMSLDEYCSLARFMSGMAVTLDRTPEPEVVPKPLSLEDEIGLALDRLLVP